MADSSDRVVATNRRARREFDLLDTWEAGLVLRGSEVKSLRESKVQIAESFVRSEGKELWLSVYTWRPIRGPEARRLATTRTGRRNSCFIGPRSAGLSDVWTAKG